MNLSKRVSLNRIPWGSKMLKKFQAQQAIPVYLNEKSKGSDKKSLKQKIALKRPED